MKMDFIFKLVRDLGSLFDPRSALYLCLNESLFQAARKYSLIH